MADPRINTAELVEIPMAIEDRFGIEISDEEAEACITVGDYCRLTRAKLALLHPAVPEMVIINIPDPLSAEERERVLRSLDYAKGAMLERSPVIIGFDEGSGESQP